MLFGVFYTNVPAFSFAPKQEIKIWALFELFIFLYHKYCYIFNGSVFQIHGLELNQSSKHLYLLFELVIFVFMTLPSKCLFCDKSSFKNTRMKYTLSPCLTRVAIWRKK